jgi:hypothetical protein
MITVKNYKGKTFTIPNAWEELTPPQYVSVAQLLMRLTGREINLYDFRFALLRELTGFHATGKKYSEPEVERICSNLIFLSEKITFALRRDGEGYRPNLSFRRNPKPQLRAGRKTFAGARFTVDRVVDTDITARQFCDAYDILAGFADAPDEALLNALCAILYGGLKPYALSEATRLAKSCFAQVAFPQKYAVMIWFAGVAQWLVGHPVYSVLFAGKNAGGAGPRISLGMSESIMQLSHAGFGSVDGIGALPVTDFFDLMVKDLKLQLSEAIAKGAKKENIIRQTGLTYAQLSALTQLAR